MEGMPKDTVAMIRKLIPALKSHQNYASKHKSFDPACRNVEINELLHQLMDTMYLRS